MRGETCADRIEDDVARGLEQVLFRFDRTGVEAALEDVPREVVAPIEVVGEAEVEPVHSIGQIRLRGLDERVVVVRHLDVREAPPAVVAADPLEQALEVLVVVEVAVDRLPSNAASTDVVDAAALLDSL